MRPWMIDAVVKSSLLIASWGAFAALAHAEAPVEIRLTLQTDQSLRAMNFSADGRRVATAGSRWKPQAQGEIGDLRIWETRTGKLLRAITSEEAAINAVAFSRDGRFLAATVGGKKVMLWEAASGQLVRTFETTVGLAERLGCVAFSDDGRLLAAGGSHGPRLIGQGGYVQLWEVETGQPMGMLERGTTGVTAILFARDRKHLIEAAGAGIDEEEIAFWNYRAGSGLEAFQPDRIGEVRVRLPFNTRPGHAKTRVDGLVLSLALSPDGSLLAAGGMVYDGFAGGGANAEPKDKAGQVKIYESRTGKLIRTFPELPEVVLAVCFAADGKTLVAVSADKAEPITRWDVATGRKRNSDKVIESGNLVVLAPDGRSLAFRERDGDVLIVPISAGDGPPEK